MITIKVLVFFAVLFLPVAGFGIWHWFNCCVPKPKKIKKTPMKVVTRHNTKLSAAQFIKESSKNNPSVDTKE